MQLVSYGMTVRDVKAAPLLQVLLGAVTWEEAVTKRL